MTTPEQSQNLDPHEPDPHGPDPHGPDPHGPDPGGPDPGERNPGTPGPEPAPGMVFRARFGDGRGTGRDPLPPEVEPELRAIDVRLANAARRALDRTPPGLEDGVYARSVRLLPRPVRRAAERVTAGRVARMLGVRTATGRLALAAALGLASVLAWTIMDDAGGPASGPETGAGLVAAADPVADPAADPGAAHAGPVTHVALDLRFLADDEPFEDMDRAVAYLLDTKSLTMADLTGEIDSIVASSEM